MNILLRATGICIPVSVAGMDDEAGDVRYACYESDPVQEDMQLAS